MNLLLNQLLWNCCHVKKASTKLYEVAIMTVEIKVSLVASITIVVMTVVVTMIVMLVGVKEKHSKKGICQVLYVDIVTKQVITLTNARIRLQPKEDEGLI